MKRLLIALTVAMPLLSWSFDSMAGQTLSVYGVGNNSCGRFLIDISVDSSQAQKNTYFEWLAGYVTAWNDVSENGELTNQDLRDAFEWVKQWCSTYPTSNFITSSSRFVHEEMHGKNQKVNLY